jgi:Zn-dependent M16 (insulinase) family peptidase
LVTLDNYDASAAFLQNLDLDPAELTKSIIGAIGEMDAYQLPDAKGYASMTRYLAGDSDEDRQRWREQVLDATVDDFHAFGDALARLNERGRVVVLGSKDAIDRANTDRGGAWLDIKKIL